MLEGICELSNHCQILGLAEGSTMSSVVFGPVDRSAMAGVVYI